MKNWIPKFLKAKMINYMDAPPFKYQYKYKYITHELRLYINIYAFHIGYGKLDGIVKRKSQYSSPEEECKAIENEGGLNG